MPSQPIEPASTAADPYAFEVTLHPRPAEATTAGLLDDDWGSWPVLHVPRNSPGRTLTAGFDETLDRFARLPRMFAEPDGSFVWVSPAAGEPWQVDGNLFERQGKVLLVDLKGCCPPAEFDRLLAGLGWPTDPLMFELVRAGVFLDEATFRRHAAARGAAGDGQRLRPR